MPHNLILSGGVAHDYPATSSALAEVLSHVGIHSEVQEDFGVLESEALQDFDMLTLNCARWTCAQTPAWGEWRFTLSARAREGLLRFLASGRGLLALHCATLCFDDWPEYRRILGAWWEWGHSGHAPLQEHTMRLRSTAHPLTRGLADFTIFDELYTHARILDSVEPLVEATWEGTAHPILWVREYGTARVCYNALGHGVEAFANPTNQTLLQRGARWVLARSIHQNP